MSRRPLGLATPRLVSALSLWLFGTGLTGCDERQKPTPQATVPQSTLPSKSATPKDASSVEPAAREAPPEPEPSSESDETVADAGTGDGVLSRDAERSLSDVAAGGPASATAHGVVMITRNDELLRAGFRGKQARRGVEPLDVPAKRLSRVARPPAVLSDRVYWVSEGRLVRKTLTGADSVQVLASDARDGTRVAAAALPGSETHAVAYIARDPGARALKAKLWVDGQASKVLSPDGTAAISVDLIATKRGLLAAFLEGRSAMTPFHVRTLERAEKGLSLDEDVVVWVGSSAQSTTDLRLIASESQVWLLTALSRGIVEFGMARIHVTLPPKMRSNVTWLPYPNGVDPAPVSVANGCPKPIVVYAVPQEARPHAPQELRLATLGEAGLGAPQTIARAGAFRELSLSAVDGGMLVAYVADQRTWALWVRCPV